MDRPTTPGRSRGTSASDVSASSGTHSHMGTATSATSSFAQSDPDSPRLRASTLAYRPQSRVCTTVSSPPTPRTSRYPLNQARSNFGSADQEFCNYTGSATRNDATYTSSAVPRTPMMQSDFDNSFSHPSLGISQDDSHGTLNHTPAYPATMPHSAGIPGPIDRIPIASPRTPVRSLSQPQRSHHRSASNYRCATASSQPGSHYITHSVTSQSSHQRTSSASRNYKHDICIPGTNEPVPPSAARKPQKRTSIGPWDLIKSIGAGSMGQVKLAVNRNTKQLGAVKIVPKAFTQRNKDSRESNEAKDARVIREAAIGQLLNHPNISRLYNVYSMTGHFYLVFEYINGGQMLDYIIAYGCVKETQARRFARSISSALDYCHHNSVVHRDLKIENILIADDGDIRLIDFGLSNMFRRDDLLRTFCGSLYFAAPELLNALPYVGPEIDVWSFGVVLYVLVCGKVPFEDKSMTVLHAKIKRGTVEYPQWLSSLCVDLLSRMLTVDPSERATLSEVMHHPWMMKGYDSIPDSKLPRRVPLTIESLDPKVIEEMEAIGLGDAYSLDRKLRNILSGSEYQMALDNWYDQQQIDLGKFNNNLSPASSDTSRNRVLTTQSNIFSRLNSNSGFANLHLHNNQPQSPITVVPHSPRESRLPDPLDSFAPEISSYFLTKEKIARERKEDENMMTPLVSSEPSNCVETHREGMSVQNDISQHLSSPEPNIKMGRLRAKTIGSASDSNSPNKWKIGLKQKPGVQPPITRLDFTAQLNREGNTSALDPTEPPQPVYVSSIPQHAPPTGILSNSVANPVIELGTNKEPSSAGLDVGFDDNNITEHSTIASGKQSNRIVSQPLPQQFSTPQQPVSAGSTYSQPISLFRRLSLRRKFPGHGRAKSTSHAIPESFDARSRRSDNSDTSQSSQQAMPSIESPKPVFFRGIFSVQTTSTKPLKEIRAEIIRVLNKQRIEYLEIKGGFACVARTHSSALKENISTNSSNSSPSTSRSSADEGRNPSRHSSANYGNHSNELDVPTPQTPPSASMRHRRMLSESGIISPSASVGGSLESIDIEIGASDMLGNSHHTASVPVRFEIEIVRVPIISLHGIQFKKLTGNVWYYKNIAQSILADLHI